MNTRPCAQLFEIKSSPSSRLPWPNNSGQSKRVVRDGGIGICPVVQLRRLRCSVVWCLPRSITLVCVVRWMSILARPSVPAAAPGSPASFMDPGPPAVPGRHCARRWSWQCEDRSQQRKRHQQLLRPSAVLSRGRRCVPVWCPICSSLWAVASLSPCSFRQNLCRCRSSHWRSWLSNARPASHYRFNWTVHGTSKKQQAFEWSGTNQQPRPLRDGMTSMAAGFRMLLRWRACTASFTLLLLCFFPRLLLGRPTMHVTSRPLMISSSLDHLTDRRPS